MSLKVYVSSTYEDLRPYRDAVIRQLRKFPYQVIAMEDYAASDKRPVERCLEDVRCADIYVGIFAWRYGYVPRKNNPKQRSITELEFEEAARRGKLRLLFVLAEKTPWPPEQRDVDTGENGRGRRIRALRRRLVDLGAVPFEGPQDLAAAVQAATSKWHLDRLSALSPAVPSANSEQAVPRTDQPKLWRTSSAIRVRFRAVSDALAERIIRVANIWNAYANIRFVRSDARSSEVRVGTEGGGAWSYVGTDCLKVPSGRITMNLGRLHDSSGIEEIEPVVLHEFGHVLGLPHEYQNPWGSIPWNKERVYAYFARSLRRSKQVIDDSVLSRYPKKHFPFEKPFDPQSIMTSYISAELTDGTFSLQRNLSLSNIDKAFVGRLYPFLAS